MSQRRSTQLTAFAGAAAVVTITAILIVAGATHDDRHPNSPRGPQSGRVPRVAGRSTATPAHVRPGPPVSSARVARIARRFAASWRAWDTGRRSAHDLATLRRLSVAGLWQRLRQQRAGPTASGPPASLALKPVRAIAFGRGAWRAALIARHHENGYLATLVIVTTAAGPRVAGIDR